MSYSLAHSPLTFFVTFDLVYEFMESLVCCSIFFVWLAQFLILFTYILVALSSLQGRNQDLVLQGTHTYTRAAPGPIFFVEILQAFNLLQLTRKMKALFYSRGSNGLYWRRRFCRPWLGMDVANLYTAHVSKLATIARNFPNVFKAVIVEKVCPLLQLGIKWILLLNVFFW